MHVSSLEQKGRLKTLEDAHQRALSGEYLLPITPGATKEATTINCELPENGILFFQGRVGRKLSTKIQPA